MKQALFEMRRQRDKRVPHGRFIALILCGLPSEDGHRCHASEFARFRAFFEQIVKRKCDAMEASLSERIIIVLMLEQSGV